MKGSRVQSIIKELRGEKIDIIEWSDEPSIFAANALSPAKVSQVRITDIDTRKMEVIVPEDQLSLAIGKFGQNVRLATKLVGWNIDIISEEVLKTEIAKQMSEMIASGEAVPLAALQVVNEAQADTLDEKGIDDIEKLAALSIDELVETLDISLDEAEEILAKANSILEARDAKDEEVDSETESETVSEETETAEENVETVETVDEAVEEAAETSENEDSTAEGYDEAVAGLSDEDDETAEDNSEDVYDEVETETSEVTDSDREEIAEISNELLTEPSPELNAKMISGEDSSEDVSDETENVTEKTDENPADKNSDEEENR
jgi:N utilization substance protein A